MPGIDNVEAPYWTQANNHSHELYQVEIIS